MSDVTTEMWSQYQHGLAYQSSIGLSKKLPQFVKFYEGEQWAPATDKTRNLPRPVLNIIKMICRNKKAAILSTPVQIVYKAEDTSVPTEKFNRFADYIQKEYGQANLDKKAVHDGVVKGCYVYHYYWDAEAKGKNGRRQGGLRCEIIDPLNIFFANPCEVDEQKQKWIIIASREPIDSVRAKADADVNPDDIGNDEIDDKYGTKEQEGTEMVTVLTKYFRQNGEVFCARATKSVVVNKPFSITPDVESAMRAMEEDEANTGSPDDEFSDAAPKPNKMYYYPVVVGNYEPREKCIYGLGEVEGLIPNQKAINFNMAMMLLNAQEMAWGKYIVSSDALGKQTITNEPGQVLVDYSKTGNGIRKMSESGMNTQSLNLIESIASLTRSFTGSSEVMTGETVGANMSGAAIAQLQSQAQMPIEELKDAFWLVKEKQGKILAQYFTHYYEQYDFSYTVEEDDAARGIKAGTVVKDVFSSSEYAMTGFDVSVEATSGTKASAAGDINALDNLLAKGALDVQAYVQAYPDDALTNKSVILKGIEAAKQDQLAAASEQIKMLTEKLAESANLLKRQQDTVDKVVSVINENNQLKAMLATLYTEAKGKIEMANAQINAGNQKIAETTADAEEMARVIQQSARNGGVNIVR